MHAYYANVKEDRMLEKSLITLRLEQNFALKLLQLDSMQVSRVYNSEYKRNATIYIILFCICILHYNIGGMTQ